MKQIAALGSLVLAAAMAMGLVVAAHLPRDDAGPAATVTPRAESEVPARRRPPAD